MLDPQIVQVSLQVIDLRQHFCHLRRHFSARETRQETERLQNVHPFLCEMRDEDRFQNFRGLTGLAACFDGVPKGGADRFFTQPQRFWNLERHSVLRLAVSTTFTFHCITTSSN